MKIKHPKKRYPFLLMLLTSTAFLTGIGFIGKNNIYSNYSITLLNTPQLAVVFQGAGEGIYPWTGDVGFLVDNTLSVSEKQSFLEAYKNADIIKDGFEAADADNEGIIESNTIKEASEDITKPLKMPASEITSASSSVKKPQAMVTPNTGKEEKAPKKMEKGIVEDTANENKKENSLEKASREGNASSSASDKKEEPISEDAASASNIHKAVKRAEISKTPDAKSSAYEFTEVTKEYFDDALFIGDSRTVGLSEYSDLSNSTFYADVGLTIYDIFDKKIATLGTDKVTILEALRKKQFKKIYIMLGINEMGTGTTKTFTDEYQRVIETIRQLQPDSLIFVEGIMNVSREKSDADPIFNNTNIKERNDSIAQLADNISIFYIDVNEAITDKKGNLPSKYTFDYIHLKAAYYALWTDFLLKHGVKI